MKRPLIIEHCVMEIVLRPRPCLASKRIRRPPSRPTFRRAPRPCLKRACTSSSGVSKTVSELMELNAGNYYDYIEKEAGSDLVVVDFYTDWCGPCKLIYPELVLMQNQYAEAGVRFVKFNCSPENKAVGKALDIRVAPTFILYKNGEQLASMTGAKLDQLRSLVELYKG